MLYKVNAVEKDEIQKVRYVGNDLSKMKELIKLDNYRDLACFMMISNPDLTYDQAYMVAKGEISLNDIKNKEVENLDNVIEKEKVKVKVLQLENDSK